MKLVPFIVLNLILSACNQPIGVTTQPNPSEPASPSPTQAWNGGDETGNGGGETPLTFYIIGNLILSKFKALAADGAIVPLTEKEFSSFRTAVEETRIILTNEPLVDRLGAPADMVTEPDPDFRRLGKKVIRVHEEAFKRQMENGTVFRTVFHEYMRASGIPDDQAKTLNRYYSFLDELNRTFLNDALRLKGLAMAARQKSGPVQTPNSDMAAYALKNGVPSRRVELESDRRREALIYLVNLADTTGYRLAEIELHLSALHLTDVEKRRHALKHLLEIEKRSEDFHLLMQVAIPTLVQVFADPDDEVGVLNTRLLARLGEPALFRVNQATLHPRPNVSLRAVKVLAEAKYLSPAILKSLEMLYFRDWEEVEWNKTREAIRDILVKKIPGGEKKIRDLEDSAKKFELAQKQRDYIQGRALESGFSYDSEKENLKNLRWLESNVRGLQPRLPAEGPMHRTFNPFSYNEVYDWDQTLNVPVWRNGDTNRGPTFFINQLRTHFLLQYYSKDTPVPIPTINDTILRELSAIRPNNYRDILYHFTPAGAFMWSTTSDAKLSGAQYLRQAYAYHVLCSWGAHRHVEIPNPIRLFLQFQ